MKQTLYTLTLVSITVGLASGATTIVAPTVITLTGDTGTFAGRTVQNGTANWFNGVGLSDSGASVQTGDVVPSVFPTHAYGNESRIRSSAPLIPEPELTITLGGTFDLTSIVLWNHGEGSATDTASDRGFESVTISFSTDGIDFTTLATEALTFAKGPQGSAPIPAQVVDFSATYAGVTHLRFNDIVTFAGPPASGNDLRNIAEMRFIAIPEPSSAALLGLGVLGLFARRRR